jgi:hypothetical protein
MSSLLTSFAQVDTRIKFLKALGTTTVYTPTTTTTNRSLSGAISSAVFTASTTPSTYASGTVFRDMGKSIIVYNTLYQDIAKYTLVQPQKGRDSEGVPDNYTTQKFYVQVWAASDTPIAITVGRVG